MQLRPALPSQPNEPAMNTRHLRTSAARITSLLDSLAITAHIRQPTAECGSSVQQGTKIAPSQSLIRALLHDRTKAAPTHCCPALDIIVRVEKPQEEAKGIQVTTTRERWLCQMSAVLMTTMAIASQAQTTVVGDATNIVANYSCGPNTAKNARSLASFSVPFGISISSRKVTGQRTTSATTETMAGAIATNGRTLDLLIEGRWLDEPSRRWTVVLSGELRNGEVQAQGAMLGGDGLTRIRECAFAFSVPTERAAPLKSERSPSAGIASLPRKPVLLPATSQAEAGTGHHDPTVSAPAVVNTTLGPAKSQEGGKEETAPPGTRLPLTSASPDTLTTTHQESTAPAPVSSEPAQPKGPDSQARRAPQEQTNAAVNRPSERKEVAPQVKAAEEDPRVQAREQAAAPSLAVAIAVGLSAAVLALAYVFARMFEAARRTAPHQDVPEIVVEGTGGAGVAITCLVGGALATTVLWRLFELYPIAVAVGITACAAAVIALAYKPHLNQRFTVFWTPGDAALSVMGPMLALVALLAGLFMGNGTLPDWITACAVMLLIAPLGISFLISAKSNATLSATIASIGVKVAFNSVFYLALLVALAHGAAKPERKEDETSEEHKRRLTKHELASAAATVAFAGVATAITYLFSRHHADVAPEMPYRGTVGKILVISMALVLYLITTFTIHRSFTS